MSPTVTAGVQTVSRLGRTAAPDDRPGEPRRTVSHTQVAGRASARPVVTLGPSAISRHAGCSLAPSAQAPVPRPPRRAPVRYETGDPHRHARGDAGHRRCRARTRRGPHRAGRARPWPAPPAGMLGGTYGRRVVVVAGKGNNGNDGRAAAAAAAGRGVQVHRARRRRRAAACVPPCDLVIDAAYGTGFRGDLGRRPTPAGPPVLAVDIPSGVDGLTGGAEGPVLPADRTVTFAALKPGLLFAPGPAAGRRGGGGRHRPDGAVGGAPRRGVRRRRAGCRRGPRHPQVAGRGVGRGGLAGHARRRAPRDAGGPAGRRRHGAAVVARRGGTIRCSPTEAVGAPVDREGFAAVMLDELDRFHALVVGPGPGPRPRPRSKASAGSCAEAALPVLLDGDGLFAVRERARGASGTAPRRPCSRPTTASTPSWPARRPATTGSRAARRLAARSRRGGAAEGSGHGGGRARGRGARGVAPATSGWPRPGTGDVLSGTIGVVPRPGCGAVRGRRGLGAWVHGSAAELGPARGLVAGDLPDLIPRRSWPAL